MTTTAAAAARRSEMDATVGLLVFFGTTAMLFAALLLAYAVLRAQAPHWPPPAAPPLPRGLAGVNTLVLLGASAALWRARRCGDRRDGVWLVAAGALGAGFLAGQILLWRHLVLVGLGQLPGQVFLALSALHALHVAAGLIVLLVSRRIRLVGLYWDFVLAVWIVLYLAVCWL